jgi:hypothetical protein
MNPRRSVFSSVLGLGADVAAVAGAARAQQNIAALPFTMCKCVNVFHLVAEL